MAMRKITNEQLGRPSPEEFELMPKIPVTVVLDNVRSHCALRHYRYPAQSGDT